MIGLRDIKTIIENSVECGYQQAQSDIEPQTDIVRKKEVLAILRRRGYGASFLNRLVDAGLVTAVKGKNNSPYTYSLLEVKKALLTISVSDALNS